MKCFLMRFANLGDDELKLYVSFLNLDHTQLSDMNVQQLQENADVITSKVHTDMKKENPSSLEKCDNYKGCVLLH